MKSINEKMERIESAWAEEKHYALIFEWVKTGVLSKKEFQHVLQRISQLDENESRTLYG